VKGKTPLIVELKGYNDVNTLCILAMEELKNYEGLYCVESFDPRIVRWFRQNHPGIIRGQLMEHLQRGKNGMSGAQAFFGRNLMTNFLTRPNFEAYDFNWRNNISLRAARRVFGMQEVSWTLRSEEAFRLAKSAGNLCIFEHILPVKAEEWKERSFEELLKNRKAVALAELKTATAPKVR